MFVAMPTRDWPLDAPATMSTIQNALGKCGGTLAVLAHSPWVGIARAELVGRFLESSEQELFWIDADISFDVGVLDAMRAAESPCITATYRKRKPPHDFTMRTLRGEHPTEAPMRFVNGARVIEIESDGLGCCLVQRHVIETLTQKHTDLAYVNDSGAPRTLLFEHSVRELDGIRRAVGEDWAFFDRVRVAGFKVECLVDATIVHDGISGCLADVFDK